MSHDCSASCCEEKPKPQKRIYWDVELPRLGRERCARLLQAIFMHQGQIHDTHFQGPGDKRGLYACPHWFSGTLRISLPESVRAADFDRDAGVTLRTPPRNFAGSGQHSN